jgi:hypothetical protein
LPGDGIERRATPPDAMAASRSACAGSNFLIVRPAPPWFGAVPITWSCAAPSIARVAAASATKRRFVLATVATPTLVFSLRMVPPAALMAARAASAEAACA